jgi:hypothetical protein
LLVPHTTYIHIYSCIKSGIVVPDDLMIVLEDRHV